MVHHFVVATQLRVLVLQRVEAVWALGDDFFDAHAIQHLDVRCGQHLEEVFVAAASGTVAGAHFAGPQDGHVDACALQQLGHGLGDFFVLVVE